MWPLISSGAQVHVNCAVCLSSLMSWRHRKENMHRLCEQCPEKGVRSTLLKCICWAICKRIPGLYINTFSIHRIQLYVLIHSNSHNGCHQPRSVSPEDYVEGQCANVSNIPSLGWWVWNKGSTDNWPILSSSLHLGGAWSKPGHRDSSVGKNHDCLGYTQG